MSAKRLIAIAARASSMLAVFLFGLIYTVTAPAEQSSGFFISYAAITLLIVVMGLELHTYSDREVARGMPPKVAVVGLIRVQLPWLVGAVTLLVLFGGIFGWSPLTSWLIAGNAVVGLTVQECFRLYVALGRNDAANLSMILRTTLPFALLIGLLLAGVVVDLDLVFATWLIAGLIAAGVAGTGIWRHSSDHTGTREYKPRAALRVASRFFPSVLIARGMLTLDIIIIGAVGTDVLAAAYGNGANVAAAFFTFADLAVFQWRFHSLVSTGSDAAQRKRMFRDAVAVALLGAVSIAALAMLAALGLLGSSFSSASIVGSLSVLAAAAAAAILAQATQMALYSINQDNTIFRGYLFAAAPIFGGFALAALILHEPILVVIGRALAFTALFVIFLTRLRKKTSTP